jgi:uncharacterized membrane protein YfhO
LVVSQTYYPGWQAAVDGIPTNVFRVDGTLTGVAVPAGTHEVRLVFRPLSFRIGLGLTMLSATILLTLLGGELRSQRKRTKRDAMTADQPSKIMIG